MVADTSEEAAWALSDASSAATGRCAARGRATSSQGEAVTPMIYQAARRLRDAKPAASALERGTPPKEVEGAAYAPVRGEDAGAQRQGHLSLELRAATCAVADLEWWTRGGSEYPDDVALTLAVLRAAGAGAGAKA